MPGMSTSVMTMSKRAKRRRRLAGLLPAGGLGGFDLGDVVAQLTQHARGDRRTGS
jgi:hypothetical protein